MYTVNEKMQFDEKYKTKLLFVRHGESLGNAEHRFLGHTDKDLSERGYLQVAKTTEFLSEEKIDVVYSSSLIRATNTVRPHAELRGLPVILSDNFREIYAGDWEDLLVSEIQEKWHDEFLESWRKNFFTCAVPHGESVPHLANRIKNEALRVAAENEGKTILVGCHAAAIRSLFGLLSGKEPAEINGVIDYPANASVSVVYFDGENLIPGEYSRSDHLEGI